MKKKLLFQVDRKFAGISTYSEYVDLDLFDFQMADLPKNGLGALKEPIDVLGMDLVSPIVQMAVRKKDLIKGVLVCTNREEQDLNGTKYGEELKEAFPNIHVIPTWSGASRFTALIKMTAFPELGKEMYRLLADLKIRGEVPAIKLIMEGTSLNLLKEGVERGLVVGLGDVGFDMLMNFRLTAQGQAFLVDYANSFL